MSEPPVRQRLFLVGVARSGTTLLQSFIAAHPEVTSFTESHFFTRLFSRVRSTNFYRVTGAPADHVRRFILQNDLDPADFRALLTRLPPASRWNPLAGRSAARGLIAVLDRAARLKGTDRWLEKTPSHLWCTDLIERAAVSPRARFIHIIRNGTKVVASLREASVAWGRPRSLEGCVERWNRDVATSLCRVRTSTDDIVVVFEDLVREPESVLRNLFDHLELPWRPSVLEERQRVARSLIEEGERWKAGAKDGIRSEHQISSDGLSTDSRLSESERLYVDGALDHSLYDQIRDHAVGAHETHNTSGG